ncbi:glycoside hydrolase family 127 protein [candidate division KSB1 bacterium]|nr:glycoside hydrolase family 127 protein [candidate division KSB1 bacterium]
MRKIIFICFIFFLMSCGKKIEKTELRPRPVNEMGLIATYSSSFAKLHDVPIHAVELGEGFWKTRLDFNHNRAIPSLLQLLEEHGVVDNFRRLSGRQDTARRGYRFTDSDIYKWIEAAALSLQSYNSPELKAKLDGVIDDILAAQDKDGYLNTYFMDERAKNRLTNFRDDHELYCLGHLIQAAIAFYRGSNERKLLDGAVRYADFIIERFGPGKKQCFAGHPEIEMAMVELYRTTGEKKYLDFAGYLLNDVDVANLEQPVKSSDFDYAFSGRPFFSREELVGHAVRAMYACCGATDYYLETGHPAVWNTIKKLWRDMTFYKMYITGGVGSRYSGEAFGAKYELPNDRAYTETCAAIGNLMWNWRLLNATGEAKYADLMEKILYNGFLSGVSLHGDFYFYRNPLESFGDMVRQPWYDCTCCPPNVQRTLASLPGLFYSTNSEGLWIHQYNNNELNWKLEDGTSVFLAQTTKYPWEGTIEIEILPKNKTEFSLFLRIPEWTSAASILVNGEKTPSSAVPGSYYNIRREWKKGDKVVLDLQMPVRVVYANPRLKENAASFVIQRGPVVYCIESPDHPGISIFDIFCPIDTQNPATGFKPHFDQNFLGGIVSIEIEALVTTHSLEQVPLYDFEKYFLPTRTTTMKAIPYYAWANRGASDMAVWIPWLVE